MRQPASQLHARREPPGATQPAAWVCGCRQAAGVARRGGRGGGTPVQHLPHGGGAAVPAPLPGVLGEGTVVLQQPAWRCRRWHTRAAAEPRRCMAARRRQLRVLMPTLPACLPAWLPACPAPRCAPPAPSSATAQWPAPPPSCCLAARWRWPTTPAMCRWTAGCASGAGRGGGCWVGQEVERLDAVEGFVGPHVHMGICCVTLLPRQPSETQGCMPLPGVAGPPHRRRCW